MRAPLGHLKGAAIRELVLLYSRSHDASLVRAVARAIPAELDAQLEPDSDGLGILASRWYDSRVAHALLDATVAKTPRTDRDELLRGLMRQALENGARGVYAFAIRQMVSPALYARNVQTFWRMLNDTGSREVVVAKAGAISRTWDWPGHHPLLCRLNNHTMAAIFELTGCTCVTFECTECVSTGGRECVYRFDFVPPK